MEYVFYVINPLDGSKEYLYSDSSEDSYDVFITKIPSIISRYLAQYECEEDFEFRLKLYK